jgi:hypothetical protein
VRFRSPARYLARVIHTMAPEYCIAAQIFKWSATCLSFAYLQKSKGEK